MYFFTEIEKLSSQLDEDSYGPDNVNPTTKYNVTSKFGLTDESKVFACVDANMIVQQSDVDASLVNLILQPISNLNVPIDVEYYVYRNVLKSSLIDEQNNSIAQLTSDSNDLIKRIQQANPLSDLPCSILGYDNEINGSVDVADIFNCLYPNTDSIYVPEGDWIGTFSNDNNHKIGFEVILKTDRFKVDMNYLRKGEHAVDVTGLSGLNERIKREEILNFLDPAALYGRHFDKKVKFYDPNAADNTQTTTTSATGTDSDRFIYTKLIQKFHTRNRLYLDIRSEKGYSYNFYQNYKVSDTDLNNIQIRHESGEGTFTPQEYQTNNWPIVFVESNHSAGTTNILRLKLRINDNTRPILYLKGKSKSTESTNFDYFKTSALLENGDDVLAGWTNDNAISLKIPNTQAGTSLNYICNYVKMNYFRTEYNSASPDTVLHNEHYYDSAFCSVDISDIGRQGIDSKKIESSEPVYVREPNNEDGTGNFQLNMQNGAYWDDNRILFYSKIEYKNPDFLSEKEFLNTYSQKFG
jgi:hypothetical protein